MADVERARESFARHEWRTASDSFLAAEADLDCDDLEKLAVSAYLVGKNAESDAAWTRTHQIRLAAGDLTGAVRCAFWLAFRLVNAHDRPGGNGWIARIERLLDDVPADSLDHARLAYLTGLRAAFEGDLATSETDLTLRLSWHGGSGTPN